jgi:hypothetical protein
MSSRDKARCGRFTNTSSNQQNGKPHLHEAESAAADRTAAQQPRPLTRYRALAKPRPMANGKRPSRGKHCLTISVADLRPLAALATDQNRHRAHGQNLACLASQQQFGHAAAAVRSHHDQVAAMALACSNNALGREVVFNVSRGTSHVLAFGDLRYCSENVGRVCRCSLFIFIDRKGDRSLTGEKSGPRLAHRDGRHLGIERLGQRKPLRRGLPGQFGSVGCYQDVLEHAALCSSPAGWTTHS